MDRIEELERELELLKEIKKIKEALLSLEHVETKREIVYIPIYPYQPYSPNYYPTWWSDGVDIVKTSASKSFNVNNISMC